MACTTCTNQCFCAVVQGANVTVTGSGSGADPYVVSATVPVQTVWAGTSTDPALLTIMPGGVDGHAPTFTPTETVFAATQGNGVTVVAGGSFGHTPIIRARLSTDAGNATVFGSDGGIYVSAAVAPAGWTSGTGAFGCGSNSYVSGVIPNGGTFNLIAGDGINLFGGSPNLGISVRLPAVVFPFACGVGNGMPVYCDPATGLRTNPDHNTVVTPRNVQSTFGSPGIGVSNFAVVGVAFNNPSPCRSMGVLMHYGYGSTVTDLPGGNTGTDWDFNIAGSPGYNGTFQFFQINPNAGSTEIGPERVSMQSMNWDQFVIGPGAGFATTITSAATPRVGAGVDCTTTAVISGFGTTL